MLHVSLFLSSCQKDVIESQVLVEYLESADSPLGVDYPSVNMPAIVTAEGVYTLNLTDQVYIIDIRSAEAFATGHIENAVNVGAAGVLAHLGGIDAASYEMGNVFMAC